MTSPHPTQEQRNALHALGIDDDVIQLLTPARVQEILNDGTTRDPQQKQQVHETNGDNRPPASLAELFDESVSKASEGDFFWDTETCARFNIRSVGSARYLHDAYTQVGHSTTARYSIGAGAIQLSLYAPPPGSPSGSSPITSRSIARRGTCT